MAPSAPVRLCSGAPDCATPATKDGRCPLHQRVQGRRDQAIRRAGTFYNEPRWRGFSRQYRIDHAFCANPQRSLRCTLLTDVTDHVVPFPEHGTRNLFYAGPFQPLCWSCHSAKTAREVSPTVATRPQGGELKS